MARANLDKSTVANKLGLLYMCVYVYKNNVVIASYVYNPVTNSGKRCLKIKVDFKFGNVCCKAKMGIFILTSRSGSALGCAVVVFNSLLTS